MSEEINIDLSSIESDQYLTFILSDEEFGIPVMSIKEIIEYGNLTNVPMVPDFIQGVVNLRGNVVPVISLANKFNFEAKAIDKRTCIIIMDVQLGNKNVVMGVVVDKVLQVIEIPDTNIEPAPSLGATIQTDFIKGMGKIDDDFLIILDVVQVLSGDEMTMMQDMNKKDSIK
ncbi:MAG: chemotaxis protein CheW [Pseudomonadota bacterium]